VGVNSVNKLIIEPRLIAKEYRLAADKTLPATPEIAINDAISMLELTANDENKPFYDAIYKIGEDHLKIQKKGRVIFNERGQGHRLG